MYTRILLEVRFPRILFLKKQRFKLLSDARFIGLKGNLHSSVSEFALQSAEFDYYFGRTGTNRTDREQPFYSLENLCFV